VLSCFAFLDSFFSATPSFRVTIFSLNILIFRLKLESIGKENRRKEASTVEAPAPQSAQPGKTHD
jgi:hypothetical protein